MIFFLFKVVHRMLRKRTVFVGTALSPSAGENAWLLHRECKTIMEEQSPCKTIMEEEEQSPRVESK